MPVVEATISEVFRYGCPSPLTQHRAIRDTSIAGYDVPKDTMVFANFYAVSRDPTAWEEPERFMPARFLSADLTQVVHSEFFYPFGVGARSCIGELLSRNVLFLFTVAMFQKFRVRPQSGEKLDVTRCFYSSTIKLKPFEVIFEELVDTL